ncbi:MAG: hypothetical protein ACK5F7_12130, partial [Planctomycetaceae bacterium]
RKQTWKFEVLECVRQGEFRRDILKERRAIPPGIDPPPHKPYANGTSTPASRPNSRPPLNHSPSTH